MNNKKKDEDIFFLGPLYQIEDENEISKNVRGLMPSAAPNIFQWSLIKGIEQNLTHNIRIINSLPVGTWPNHYRHVFLKNEKWENGNGLSFEIGGINIPFLKQYTRYILTKRVLKREVNNDTKIIIYSTYLPFLKAVKKIASKAEITLIVTDLPEYYDLSSTSRVSAFMRNIQNRMLYKSMDRVDKFILLTEYMKEKLPISNRPSLILEGVYNGEFSDICTTSKKIIFYAGTLRYVYGIKNLIEAFKGIEDVEVELWICGSGEAEEELKELAKVNSRVHFFGFCNQEQVARLRSQATVLVNPRQNEGEYTKYSFPSKTMEYMASGKPVVMYKLDGIPNEYDEYLFYVNGCTSNDLKIQLEQVLSQIDFANEKAKRAQEFIRNNKTAKIQGDRVFKFLNE